MSRFFIDKSYYFITVPTINHQKFFNTPEKKKILLNRLIKAKDKYQIKKLDFGIISNHYHLVAYFENKNVILGFLQLINGGSSFELNRLENKKGRIIWEEYHIYYINNEIVLSKIKGYSIGNPYKHGEVASLEELINYPFSTYKNLVNEIGRQASENLVLSVIKMGDEDIKKELKGNLAKASY